ncbi:MAG: hypothetical protein P4L42_02625 [Desulfocapsaceae bacterium]|nr:hypothetical protein [Desulfocapsaceae bacterium]
MKYLFIILIILLGVSAATFFFILPEQPKDKQDILITINGHDILRKDIQSQGANAYRHTGSDDYLNTIITRQLLIEEAQKLAIDREASFRNQLKEYYEQSLINILMQRKNASLQVQVSDEEIENFINCYGKTYTFFILKTRDLPTVEFLKKNGVRYSARFEDLGQNLELTLANLKQGEMALAFETISESSAVFLEKVEGNSERSAAMDHEKIRTLLTEQKKMIEINNWMNQLRKNASITIKQ